MDEHNGGAATNDLWTNHQTIIQANLPCQLYSTPAVILNIRCGHYLKKHYLHHSSLNTYWPIPELADETEYFNFLKHKLHYRLCSSPEAMPFIRWCTLFWMLSSETLFASIKSAFECNKRKHCYKWSTKHVTEWTII
jgi:hypothetical protein